MSDHATTTTNAECVGRYVLYPPIARGGMASVHAARLVGAEGFSRLVAAKRLHPHFSEDPDFVAMFHDEARIASRIHHPNVVPVLDVVCTDRDTVLVQEYVHGVPLSYLMKVANATAAPVPVPIVVAIIAGVLAGLHGAHEARDELDVPLGIIHRDVSPQNIMISVEGVPRLLDFGIAKARTSAHHTREGIFKGKLAYVAPEQIRLEPLTRSVDVYAVGVIMWELLASRRFNDKKADAEFVAALVEGTIPSIPEACAGTRTTMSDGAWERLVALDAIVARARDITNAVRYASAAEMLAALLDAHEPASARDVAEWVRDTAGQYIARRQRELALNEENWHSLANVSSAGGITPMRIERGGRGAPDTSPTSSDLHAQRAPSSLSPIESAEKVEPKRRVTHIVGATLAIGFAVLVGLSLGSSRAGTWGPTAAAIAPSPYPKGTWAPAPPAPAEASMAPTSVRVAASSSPVTSVFAPVVTVAPTHAPPWRPPAARSATAAQSASASASTSAAPSVADCNPPFYFDGAKKIFKRSCL